MQALHFKQIGFNLHDTMIYAKNNYVVQNHNRYDQQFEYMFVLSRGKPRSFQPLKIPTTTKRKVQYQSDCAAGKDNSSFRRTEDRVMEVRPYKYRPNIWFYSIGAFNTASDDIAFQHPAIFPEQLAEDHIKSWSNEGDVILDPFAGSGTTLKAAEKLNRKWVGIEISKEYIEIANKRLAPLMNQSRLI